MVADRVYARPVPCPAGLPGAWSLAGGVFGFQELELLQRNAPIQRLPVEAAAALYPVLGPLIEKLDAPRVPIAGLTWDRPRLMGVVNVTPDSFSDGGRHSTAEQAIGYALSMVEAGADILDVGGESTRPGAEPVGEEEELARVLPVIEGLRAAGCTAPISIDTRKALVAEGALAAGAVLFNDVSALAFDPASVDVAATAPGVCLMHAQGDPKTMQQAPSYGDALLDIYDYLAERVALAEGAGIDRSRILLDPGIGFGKTLQHNLALLRRLSLFHGLGCPILLGASRKGFIGALSGEKRPERRAPGSIAVGLAALAQGVHILRVHDVAETAQAIAVWRALVADEAELERE
ncbi:MAG: dihydropteroate synthase [Pseudomonadota bacterium]